MPDCLAFPALAQLIVAPVCLFGITDGSAGTHSDIPPGFTLEVLPISLAIAALIDVLEPDTVGSRATILNPSTTCRLSLYLRALDFVDALLLCQSFIAQWPSPPSDEETLALGALKLHLQP